MKFLQICEIERLHSRRHPSEVRQQLITIKSLSFKKSLEVNRGKNWRITDSVALIHRKIKIELISFRNDIDTASTAVKCWQTLKVAELYTSAAIVLLFIIRSIWANLFFSLYLLLRSLSFNLIPSIFGSAMLLGHFVNCQAELCDCIFSSIVQMVHFLSFCRLEIRSCVVMCCCCFYFA